MSIACMQPMQFSRFSDGELFMMLGKSIRLTPSGAWIDGKQVNTQRYEDHDCKTFYPNSDMAISNELIQAVGHTSPGYVAGLPLPCCIGQDMSTELNRVIGQAPVLWSTANLFINANYPFFIESVLPIILSRPVVLIANYRANTAVIPNLVGHIPLGDDCKPYIDGYTMQIEALVSSMSQADRHDSVFLFAGSYISNLLIYRATKKWNDLTLLDIGTSLHPLLRLKIYRHYLHLYWQSPKLYSYHQCVMKL